MSLQTSAGSDNREEKKRTSQLKRVPELTSRSVLAYQRENVKEKRQELLENASAGVNIPLFGWDCFYPWENLIRGSGPGQIWDVKWGFFYHL